MNTASLNKKVSLAFFFALALLVISCKKEAPAQQQHSASQSTTSSLTVDDTAVANLSHSSFNNAGNFAVIGYGPNGNPEVQITFVGTQQPSSGQYLVVSGSPTYGKCTFAFSNSAGTSTASSGVVTIAYSSGTTYAASFSNINVSGAGGNHKVTGVLMY